MPQNKIWNLLHMRFIMKAFKIIGAEMSEMSYYNFTSKQ